MKLVDILARELKVWPEGVFSITQDYDLDINEVTIECTPATTVAVGTIWIANPGRIQISEFETKEQASDFATAIVTRAEWQAAVDALKAPKVVEWDGAGFPPVGLDVEIKRGNCTWIDGDEWQIGKTATVMASFLNSRDIEMASVQFPGGHCECILARCLSPIRAAEQVAAEERENAAIDLAFLITGHMDRSKDCAKTIGEIIHDAGYRKEPKQCGS